MSKDDFKYLRQEFYNNVLDLVKQKGFYSYEYMSDFEKFKKELPSKEKFYSFLTERKITDKFIKELWIMSKSFFECSRFKLGCNA